MNSVKQDFGGDWMKKVALFVFSGTGNTYYVAKKIQDAFSDSFVCSVYSMEKHMLDASKIIEDADLVGIGYPIYGSSLPEIVFEFINRLDTHQKRAFTFCTQMMFSGDGAAYGGRILGKKGFEVLWQEHFNMPNNLTDVGFLHLFDPGSDEKIQKRIEKKANRLVKRIESMKPRKMGSNPFSLFLGLLQRLPYDGFKHSKRPPRIRIHQKACIACGTCVDLCPSGNLFFKEGILCDEDKCILCYRCVNHCPTGALTVFSKKPLKKPYLGPYKGFDIRTVKEDHLRSEKTNQANHEVNQ